MQRTSLLKFPLGDSEVFIPPEGEPLPGECSPKSDTTLKRSQSLCQEENDKMPTYNEDDDDDANTPLEQPSHITPTPAIPVSASFDSSENEVVDSPERNTPKEQVKIIEEDPEGAAIPADHDDDVKQKIHKSIGQKFQHYTRVPQLRKDVRNKVVRMLNVDDHFVALGGEE